MIIFAYCKKCEGVTVVFEKGYKKLPPPPRDGQCRIFGPQQKPACAAFECVQCGTTTAIAEEQPFTDLESMLKFRDDLKVQLHELYQKGFFVAISVVVDLKERPLPRSLKKAIANWQKRERKLIAHIAAIEKFPFTDPLKTRYCGFHGYRNCGAGMPRRK